MPIKLQQFAAALALILVAVPMAATAGIVWLLLGRPLMFRQPRVGYRMRPFTVTKFRTMSNARDASGELLPDAERETPVTRFLRRIRLDESPQLWTILRGEMAWVGPRPLLPATIEAFGEPGRVRCSVRPGLTGWAQIHGNTFLTDRQKLAMDLWYVDHRSFMLDLYILLRTAWTVLRGERVDEARVAEARTHFAARYGSSADPEE